MWQFILPLITAGANYMSGRQQAKAAQSQAAAQAISGGGFMQPQQYNPWAAAAGVASGTNDLLKIQDDIIEKKKKLEAIERRRNKDMGGADYGYE